MLCPAWVDDLAVPFIEDAAGLCKKAVDIFLCVRECYWQFKLFLNMKPGKTAFLPMLARKGMEMVRRQIADLKNNCLACVGQRGEELELAVCRSYKYMGVRTYGCGTLLPELAARHSSTKPAMSRLAYRFSAKLRLR